MEAIPIFHTSNFIVSDPTKFSFIGSLPEAMLNYVPTDNELINEYQKKHVSGPFPLTHEMQKALEEVNKPKKGGKRKEKVGPSEPAQTPKKKIKRAACTPRSPFPVAQEDSDSQTVSEDIQARNANEDTEVSLQPMFLEPIPTQTTTKVSSPILTFVLSPNEPFHVPSPLPIPTTTSVPISTPITISPCPNVSVGVSQPQISVAQYTKSTGTTTTTMSSPPVTINISDMGEGASGVTIGRSSIQISPLHNDDPDIVFADDRDDF